MGRPLLFVFNEVVYLLGIEGGAVDTLWHVAQVDVAFLRRSLHDFQIVGNDREVLGSQVAYLADTGYEVHFDFRREGTHHLAWRQVDALDGHAVDALLGQHVGTECDTATLRHHLDIMVVREPAVDGQRVAETGVVERLGIDGGNAVELLRGGIDVDAVGGVGYFGDEVQLVGDDPSRPSDGYSLALSVVIEELQLVGLDGDDFCRQLQALFRETAQVARRYGAAAVPTVVALEIDGKHANLLAIEVAEQHPALVADGDADGVGVVRGQHDILGRCHMHGHPDFLLIGLVERHHKPEDARQEEKEQKNQKLLVHVTEQEVPDGAEYVFDSQRSLPPFVSDGVLLLYGRASHVLVDVALVNLDDDAVGNLHLDDAGGQVNLLDGAVDAAARDNGCAFLQRVLEILYLLLALLLGPNHKEVHDGEDGYHHNQETGHAATALCGLCGEENLCHNGVLLFWLFIPLSLVLLVHVLQQFPRLYQMAGNGIKHAVDIGCAARRGIDF